MGGALWLLLYDASFAAIPDCRPGALWAVPCGWCSVMPRLLRFLVAALVLSMSCAQRLVLYDVPCVVMPGQRIRTLQAVLYCQCFMMPRLLRVLVAALVPYGQCPMVDVL